MAIDVLAWNVLDAFSDEQRARGVLDVTLQQRPDVAVFSEAWREGQEGLLDNVYGHLDKAGYSIAGGLYEDDDGREDRHGILAIVRRAVMGDGAPRLVSMGSRNAVYAPLVNPITETGVDFFGAHFCDRAEPRRLRQATTLLKMAAASIHPIIVAGDFNALHRSDPHARVLRAVRPIAQRLPSQDPRPDHTPSRLKRIGSLGSRLADMALGTTLEAFADAGFHDADPTYAPTKGPANLDHIMIKNLVATPLEYDTYPLSDHRPIGARCHAKRRLHGRAVTL